MDRLGIGFSGGPNASEIVECVKLAESLGYESAWVAEGHGGDQFAVLAACAVQTSRILLGTDITSVFVRTPPTIAMAAATVDQLSAGRFILGLGSSHKVQVEPEHGVVYSKPLTRVRETAEFVRKLIRDERASYDGETVRVRDFDLWFKPYRPQIPIYAAAVFPKMIQTCGEIADGIILTRSSLDTAARVREHLAEGAKRVGRDPSEIVVTSLLPTAVSERREEAYDALRPGVALYAGFFPRYNKMMSEYGFAEELATIADAWKRGDREEAVRAVSDDLIRASSIVGTPDEAREQLAAYRRSGIDVPIISPFARGPGARAVFEAAIRACAPR